MNVLLALPRPPLAGTNFTRIRTLTLPSVAAELTPRARVVVVDEAVQALPAGPFDLVGISSDTPHAPRAYALADELRAQGQRVLLGGTHPTAVPDEAMQHADAVVVGEIEGLGDRLLDDLEAGTLAGVYQLSARPSLEGLAVPPVDLLPDYSQRFQPYPVELTRGCRNACRFCFNKRIHGPGFRRRPLEPVVEAVRTRTERMVLCMDDNIMNDPDHLAAFAEGRTFVTSGPMLDVVVRSTTDQAGPGQTLEAPAGTRVELDIRLQAAAWVPVDRVRVLRNGQEVWSAEIETGGPVDLFETVQIKSSGEGWLVVDAGRTDIQPEGDYALLYPNMPVFAVTAPIYLDTSGE